MSVDQDIIDTIAEAIEDAERSCGNGEYWQFGTHVLSRLREEGWALIHCECVPNTAADPNPNCPIYVEAANHGRR